MSKFQYVHRCSRKILIWSSCYISSELWPQVTCRNNGTSASAVFYIELQLANVRGANECAGLKAFLCLSTAPHSRQLGRLTIRPLLVLRILAKQRASTEQTVRNGISQKFAKNLGVIL